MIFLLFSLSCLGIILGTSIVCLIKKNGKNFITGLGFLIGIMLYMSLNTTFSLSDEILENIYSHIESEWITTILFTINIFLTFIIDKLLNNMRNFFKDFDININLINKLDFIKMFIFVLLAIIIYNIPEGIYSFYLIDKNPQSFYTVLIPMIVHNIIQGIALGFPIYYIIKDFKMTLITTFLFNIISIFVILTFVFIIGKVIDFKIISFLLNLSSALMIYIVFNYLLPFCQKYNVYMTFIGIVVGLLTMMFVLDFSPYLINIINLNI